MKISNLYLLLFLLVGTLLASCTDDEIVDPPLDSTLEVPTTYDFENVSYTGQQSRLAQLVEFKAYMQTANTAGVALDLDRLNAMYTNTDGAGYSQEYTKDLRSKTFAGVQADFDAMLVALAEDSQSTEAGSEGVAGVIVSDNGEKSYLIGENGLEYGQVFEKSLMGACLYYQATSVYLGEQLINADNETVDPVQGTEMEHYWDEAFGYFGAPIDFPLNTDGLVFWADYANKRNSELGNSEALMNALLKGRAAIDQGFMDDRNEAIDEVRKEWELVSVATALHYLNSGIENFDDKAIALHGLSEAIGFIYSLKFNDGKTISNDRIDEHLAGFAGSANFADMNLYQTTVAEITTVRDNLAADYGLTDRKESF